MKSFYYLSVTAILFTCGCKKDGTGGPGGGGGGITDIQSGQIITNQEWKSGTYRIHGHVDISNNVVLKIDPGVTIEFTDDANAQDGGELSTSDGGAIDAEGTSASQITFTGEQGVPGYWNGVDIFTNSNHNIFKYCKFQYGGKGTRSMVYVGDPNSNNIGRVSFQNCTFSNGLANGLYLNFNSFIDNSSNNTFTANAQYPVSTALEAVSQLSTSNTYTGNGSDYIYINSDYQCYANVHLQKFDVFYYVTANSGTTIQILGDCIIDPGVTIAMGSNMELEVTAQNGHTGSFNCVGTATNPITIKGFQSSQGYWDKIRFNGSTSPNNQINHTNIQDGGSYNDGYLYDKGMITAVNAPNNLTISNCNISNALFSGIYIKSNYNGEYGSINGQRTSGDIQNTLNFLIYNNCHPDYTIN